MFFRGIIPYTVSTVLFCATAMAQKPVDSHAPAEEHDHEEILVPELASPPQLKTPRVHISHYPSPPAVDVLPLPLTHPQAIRPGQTSPLSAEEKVHLVVGNVFSTRAALNRAFLAGIDQWRDEPHEWRSGFDGYGIRFGDRMARLMVRNAVQLAGDVAFKTDPRYDRCECVGFGPRVKHALKRVAVARKDNGGQMIAVGTIAGAYITPMVTDQWGPARLNTWGGKLQSGTMFFGWRGLSNIVREFWPEISGKVRIKREWGGSGN